ncbi:UBX domain-containing protein 4-like isoform X1 [Anneissia japonica]|uniref:UBX domain-containing protein 4-like isoform X1 n=1 Tax=Anneissia japonica TaxID=1529436 RepID=UPI0014259644|nr:UBX domain-containing protein 4-like isoform X1 [Anneissia japonica]
MLWFLEESTNAAIARAKQSNAIFVVYITGTNDEDTSRMDETWEDGEVQQICNEAGIVAIRLNASSTECNQFSRLYPVVCVPSVAFIDGGNGVYLEAIAGAVSPHELREKIKDVIVKKNRANQASVVATTTEAMYSQPSTSQAAADPLMTAAPQASASPGSATSQASAAPKITPDQPDKVQASSFASAIVNTSNETQEERSQRHRQKMVALREKMDKERKKKDSSNSNQASAVEMDTQTSTLQVANPYSVASVQINCKKEIERREVGKAIQEQMKTNQERETRATVEHMKEDQQWRELVRQQLEWDKLEKKARFEAEKRERDQKRKSRNIQKQEQLDEEELERKRRRMESARIQFRLPDGSTFKNEFKATAKMSEVHEFIRQKIMSHDLRSSFMMSTTFPRRNYDSDDMDRTLTELNLVPSPCIIVLPRNNRSNSNQTSAVATTKAMDAQTSTLQAATDSLFNTSDETIEKKAYRWQKMVAFQELGEENEELLTESSGTPKVPSDQPDKVQTSSSASVEVNTSNETIEEGALQENKEKKKEEGSTAVTQSDSPVLMLLSPFLALWKFINPSAGNLQSNRQGSTSDRSSGEPGPNTGAIPKSSYGHRRNVPSRGMRQEGNIYRLSQGDDDDDENKTWNGNSTQQM